MIWSAKGAAQAALGQPDRHRIAGALSISQYQQGLADVGFVDIEITATHEAGDGMHRAIIRARKPS